MAAFEADNSENRDHEEEEKQAFVDLAHLHDPYDDRTVLEGSRRPLNYSTLDVILCHLGLLQAGIVTRLAPLRSRLKGHIELPQKDDNYNSDGCRPSQSQTLLQRFLRLSRSIFLFIIPSYVRSRYFPGPLMAHSKPHPTSWLDGIRGLAALFVFFFHMSNNVFDMWHGYGSTGEGGQEYHSLLRLPILKVLWAGPAAVSVFFVVSGFALSLKPLKQMRSAQGAPLMQTISSSVFRRPIRLFVPCYVCSMIIILLARMNFYEATRDFANQGDILTGKHKYHFRMAQYFSQDLWRWGTQAIGMWQVFDWNELIFFNEFDTHFWTIPVEFRASLVLFLSQVALARLRSWLRMAITVLFAFRAIRVGRWEMVLFWGGAILAELHLISASRKASKNTAGQLGDRPTLKRRNMAFYLDAVFWIANLICSLWLIGYPDKDGKITPGYVMLTTLIPSTYGQKQRFWQGMGGLQLVWCTSNFEPLAKFFMTPFVTYLGKISFGLYLIHGTINHLCGYALFVTVYKVVGHEPGVQKVVGFLIAAGLNSACVFWAADVFWRAVDMPCVRFGKWVEEKCTSQVW